jgi:uncharacterized protein YcgI (DUF1989 family)
MLSGTVRQLMPAKRRRWACTPSPLNRFENARRGPDGSIEIAPPVSTPGSSVVLRAELDVLVVLSACPQDMAPANGEGPADAHHEPQAGSDLHTGPDC